MRAYFKAEITCGKDIHTCLFHGRDIILRLFDDGEVFHGEVCYFRGVGV